MILKKIKKKNFLDILKIFLTKLENIKLPKIENVNQKNGQEIDVFYASIGPELIKV